MASLFERYFFDAMANLGSSLGERSADNAARRQSIKARSAIDEMLGDASGADVMSAINNGQQFDLSKNTVLDPNFSLSKATPDGRSVQENAASELLDIKRRGQYPIGSSGSALQALSSASGKTPVSIEDVRMALSKRGVDEDIIEKELGYYNSKIKEQANATLVPQIMSKYNSGDYTGALQDTLTLRQHDPETASILLSGSVTPRDIYTENRADTVYGRTRQDLLTDKAEARSNKKQDAQESFALKRDAEKQQFLDQVQLFMEVYDVDYKTAAKLALGGSGTGRGKGGSGLPGSVSTQQMNAAKEEIKAFDNWREMNPDVDVKTYPRYNQLNFAYQINDAALGYGGNGGSNTSFDWNDRNAVVAKAQEAIADGQSWESVLSIAKENMVDGETYRELERLAKQNEGTADNTASKQQNYADEYLANVEKEKLAQEQYNYGQLRNQAARAGLYVDTRGKVWPMNPSYFNPNSDDGKVKVELYNQWAAANGLPAWGQ